VRAEAQAKALGYDISVVGLTNTDYVLRSVPALFLPLLGLAVLAWMLLLADRWLRRRLDGRPLAVRVLAVACRYAPLWATLAGVAVTLAAPDGDYLAVPLAMTVGVLANLYGRRLPAPPGTEPSRLGTAIVVLILVMLLFWDVERIARLFGEGFAELAVSRPHRYAAVVLFSEKDLHVDRPGVLEHRVGGDDAAYRFRYDGLRLLNYSNKRYFLLAGADSGSRPAVVVVPDLDSIRVDFASACC
jgi:hypothetical protein